MRRFNQIFRNELRLISRSPRSLALYVIYALALIAAAASGIANTGNKAQIISDALRDDSSRWATLERVLTGQPARGDPEIGPLYNVKSAYSVGAWLGQRHAVKAPTTFSGIAEGQGDLFPPVVQISVLGNAVDEAAIKVSNPNHRFVGGFDLAFVITFLLPIVVIGLNFDALSQERESKRIAFYNAIPSAPATLLLGRLATRSGIVALLTLLTAVLVPILFYPSGSGLLDGLIWAAAILIWTIIWSCLVGLVAIPNVAPGIAFLAGLGFWLTFVVVGPAAVDYQTSKVIPPPDRVGFAFNIRELKYQLLEDPNARMEEYYREHPEDRPSKERVTAVNKPLAGGSATNDNRRYLMTSYPLEKRIAPQRLAFREQALKRKGYARQIGRWVPGLAFHMIAEEISNNSRSAIEDFHRQADHYQANWRSFFVPRTMQIEPFTGADIGQVPKFEYAPQKSSERFGRVFGLMTPLVGLAILLMVGLGIAQRRLV